MMNKMNLETIKNWIKDDNNITNEGILLMTLFSVTDVNNGGKTILDIEEEDIIDDIFFQVEEDNYVESLTDLYDTEDNVSLVKIVLTENDPFKKAYALYHLLRLATEKEVNR